MLNCNSYFHPEQLQEIESFQVNSICDTTRADPSFETEFKMMQSNLQQNGIHIANLRTNLRNSKDIGQVSRNVKSFNSRVNDNIITQHIQPLFAKSTNVSSTPPLLIPKYKIRT